jgi:hypothetical protein
MTIDYASIGAVDLVTGKILWQTPSPSQGTGQSTLAVANGVLFIGGRDGLGFVYALDVTNGNVLWNASNGMTSQMAITLPGDGSVITGKFTNRYNISSEMFELRLHVSLSPRIRLPHRPRDLLISLSRESFSWWIPNREGSSDCIHPTELRCSRRKIVDLGSWVALACTYSCNFNFHWKYVRYIGINR